jgi:hypothetical protein
MALIGMLAALSPAAPRALQINPVSLLHQD